MAGGRKRALRGAVEGEVDAEAVVRTARELGVMGWVRPTGELHAEGLPDAVDGLIARFEFAVSGEKARVEGHEQFAIRGVSAGVFVVQKHDATVTCTSTSAWRWTGSCKRGRCRRARRSIPR